MINESRRTFHHELDEIKEDIIRLGEITADRVAQTTEALLAADLEAAERIIRDDDQVDFLALANEERCQSILLLQNPVAGDLRAVICALWISGELERSADLASNICKANRRIFGFELSVEVREHFSRMSEEAIRICRMAVEAYGDANEGLAAALGDIDDRLDDLHTDLLSALFAAGAADGKVKPVVQMALIGRFYERIGDHAVNIGERVQYMVSGFLPEQTGRARAAYAAEIPEP